MDIALEYKKLSKTNTGRIRPKKAPKVDNDLAEGTEPVKRHYKRSNDVKTKYNGYTYRKKDAANRAMELDLMLRFNEITEWRHNFKFDLTVNGVHICNFICDFSVTYPDGTVEYEDYKGIKKGFNYDLYLVKKRLTEVLYDVQIKENTLAKSYEYERLRRKKARQAEKIARAERRNQL
jgi:hypothetical protein